MPKQDLIDEHLEHLDKMKLHKANPNTPGFKHGYSRHPLYSIWKAINARCYDKNNKSYSRYGGRGIIVCKEWRRKFKDGKEDFQSLFNFIKWAKSRWKKGLQIDRIKNNENYFPDNCRFITCLKNNNNRENSFFIKEGKFKDTTLADFYKQSKTNIPYATVFGRYKRGYNLQNCIKELPINRGISNGQAKLNEQNVINIKKLLKQKMSQQKIADKYNVSRGAILAISRGSSWVWIK